MTYSEALDYLYSRLPVFHRIGPKALKPGLGNIQRLCAALNHPEQAFRSIHVGGTNGKGSTSHMLAAVYQSAGYRVGLYTSPHLQSFTERIRIDGKPIPEEAVAAFVDTHQALIEAVEPSFFEVTVAMAFDWFARQRVDLAVIEVGLGGRLDSTNIIQPDVAVITNIGLDHTDILGDTLPQIAREKAGIIKEGVPVVIGETNAETEPVFREVARLQAAPIRVADQCYVVADEGVTAGLRQVVVSGSEPGRSVDPVVLQLDLTGTYQVRNLLTVLATVEVVQAQWPVSVDALRKGLRAVSALTGLKGRFQTLREQPRVIADTAHNLAGLQALWTSVQTLAYEQLHLIVGMVADKDRGEVLRWLPATAHYYFCQAQTPRSLPVAQLQAEAAVLGRMGPAFPDVNAALRAALAVAASDDLILITGSNYTVAELTDL